MDDNHLETTSNRLDYWLYAARIYKTRAVAVLAIKNNRVTVNGSRSKPARKLNVGDVVTVNKQGGCEYELRILQFSPRRVGAKVAQTLYEESAASIAAREAQALQNQISRQLIAFPTHKPHKKQRRQLRAIHRNLSQ